jgi:hypothetical protein
VQNTGQGFDEGWTTANAPTAGADCSPLSRCVIVSILKHCSYPHRCSGPFQDHKTGEVMDDRDADGVRKSVGARHFHRLPLRRSGAMAVARASCRPASAAHFPQAGAGAGSWGRSHVSDAASQEPPEMEAPGHRGPASRGRGGSRWAATSFCQCRFEIQCRPPWAPTDMSSAASGSRRPCG